MKKFILLLTVSLLLLGVSCTKPEQQNSSQSAPPQTGAELTSKTPAANDYTITIKNNLDLKKYNKKQIADSEKFTQEASYRFYCPTVDEMIKQSTQVIKAEVLKVSFTDSGTSPYTVFDVKVLESYKGDLQINDTISVSISDGYMNMYDYVDKNDMWHRYSDIPKSEMKNKLIEQRSDFSDPYPKPGEIYILPLVDETVIEHNPIPGTYMPINDASTIYKIDTNGKFTRQYKTQVKLNQYKKDKNDIDGFTLEWFKKKISK